MVPHCSHGNDVKQRVNKAERKKKDGTEKKENSTFWKIAMSNRYMAGKFRVNYKTKCKVYVRYVSGENSSIHEKLFETFVVQQSW